MTETSAEITQILRETAQLHNQLADAPDDIQTSIDIILDAMNQGGTLYVMGNGGSAADAQHLAGELVGRFEMERPGLPCVALTTDTSVLTSVGNDYGIEKIFSRQVEALVKSQDAVLGISTSGTSANVLASLKLAHSIGATTVGMTGANGEDMRDCCDAVIRVPSHDTPRIQEGHASIIHIMCRILERELSA